MVFRKAACLIGLTAMLAGGGPVLADERPSRPAPATPQESASDRSPPTVLLSSPNDEEGRQRVPLGRALKRQFDFDIPATAFPTALYQWSKTSGIPHFLAEPLTYPARSQPVIGRMSARDALGKLLQNTELSFSRVKELICIEGRPEVNTNRAPEVLITTKKTTGSSNADSPRKMDDVQPYTVIDRSEVEAAGALPLEALITRRIPAVRSLSGREQTGGIAGRTTHFALRGLPGDTVVLINGRLVSSSFTRVVPLQTDLTAIPVESIQEIQILPAPASGIYGSGAGTVINIILKHDYVGTQVITTGGLSSASDASSEQATVLHSSSYNDDHTLFSFAFNAAETEPLAFGDRDFVAEIRADSVARSVSKGQQSLVPLGDALNFRSASGTGLCGAGTPSFGTISLQAPRASCSGSSMPTLGAYNATLADTAQIDGRRHTLVNGPRRHYANAYLRHELERLSIYVDGTMSQNATRNDANGADTSGFDTVFIPGALNIFSMDVIAKVPLRQADGSAASELRSRIVTAGIAYKLTETWNAGLEFNASWWRAVWSQPMLSPNASNLLFPELSPLLKPDVPTTDASSVMGELLTSPLVSRNRIASLQASGRVHELASGPITLTLRAERHEEVFAGAWESWETRGSPELPFRSLSRNERVIESAGMEWHVPLFGRLPPRSSAAATEGGLPDDKGRPRLELQVAGRFDRHVVNVSGASTSATTPPASPNTRLSFEKASPVVGIQFWVSGDIRIRSSYASSFLPPTREQSTEPRSRTIPAGKLVDPLRGGLPTTQDVLFVAGGNPDIDPEQSKSWSIGLQIEPESVPALRASLDWFWIEKRGAIVSPSGIALNVKEFEERFPRQVVRGTPGPNDVFGVGELLALNAQDINSAKIRVSAFDGFLRYESTLGGGTLAVLTRATWQPALKRQDTPFSLAQNDAGMAEQGPRFASFSELTYRYLDFSFGLDMTFNGRYAVGRLDSQITAQGFRYVSRQIYHDVWARWEIPLDNAIMSSLDLQLTVENIAGSDPPRNVAAPGYVSPFGDASGRTIWLSARMNFKH